MTTPYPDELLRLQTRIRQLEEENQHLKDLLKQAGLSVHGEDSILCSLTTQPAS